MKVYHKISVIILSCLLTTGIYGQTIHDALRFSRTDLYGTARSLAMGNAFTAIGGDVGAISVNPASSGIYRHSEFVITPGVDNYTGTSDYLSSSSRGSKTRFCLGSFGVVGYIPTGRKTGLLNINWSVTGNQTAGYVSGTNATGSNATSSWLASKAHQASVDGYGSGSLSYTSGAPWDINGAYQSWQMSNFPNGQAPDPQDTYYLANTENLDFSRPLGRLNHLYSRNSWGYTYDFAANFAANVDNKLFFGVNLVFQSIYYTDSECFREQAVDKSEFETGFEYMNYSYNRTTRGMGFKMAAGIIYRPFAGLSIGASVSTPTWTKMRDFWIQDVKGYSELYRDKKQESPSPEGDWSYKMTNPFQWNVGLGYTIGQSAVISVDYSNTNYSNVVFKTHNGPVGYYNALNDAVGTIMKSSHSVRTGLEVRVAKGISVRGGYNFRTSPVEAKELEMNYIYGDDVERYFNGQNTQTWSLGAGFRTGNFFFDVAFQQQIENVTEYKLFTDYYDLRMTEFPEKTIYTRDGDPVQAPLLTERFRPWKLLISVGFKF